MSTPSENLLHRMTGTVPAWSVDPLAVALAVSEDNGNLPPAIVERLYGPLATVARRHLGAPAWKPPASTDGLRSAR